MSNNQPRQQWKPSCKPAECPVFHLNSQDKVFYERSLLEDAQLQESGPRAITGLLWACGLMFIVAAAMFAGYSLHG